MAITKKPDGRWACVYYENGRQRWRYFGRGLEAQAAARAFDDELKAAGRIRPQRRRSTAFSPSVTELANAYLEAKRATLPPASQRALFHKLKSVILPIIGDHKAIRLTPAKVDSYVQKRLATPLTVKAGSKNRPRVKALVDADGNPRFPKLTTIHRELSDLMAILNWSATRKLIAFNPVHGYKKPTRDDAIIRPPTPTEFRKIYQNAAEHLQRALLLSFFLGLRPGNAELFNLTHDNVDLDAGIVTVISARKGGRRVRAVPIHAGLRPHLERWIAADQGKGYLVHYRGDRVKSIKTAFRNAKAAAGIARRIRPYDLRHAFATSSLAAGADLKAVSEILGHSRPDTTVRIYQHLDLDQHRAAMDRLPAPDLDG
jgi:integrase